MIDVRLTPPRQTSRDEAIEYLAEDELREVTPASLHIPKRILDMHIRARDAKRTRQALAA